MNEEWAKQLRERLNLIPHNQENTSYQPQQSTANIISLRKNNRIHTLARETPCIPTLEHNSACSSYIEIWI